MLPNKPYSISALSLAIVLALSACHREVKPAPEFKRSEYNKIVISNAVEPSTLDPQKSSDMAAGAIIRQMMDGLVGTDAEGKTIPALALKWEPSDEGRVWTFHLRDAKWSNGDPITAEDFVYSFRRLADPETAAPYSSYLEDAKIQGAAEILQGKAKPDTLGVKALDKKTLQFTLTAPVPYFPDMLIQQFTYPVHRATVEKFGEKWTQPGNYVSSGAYILKEWHVNSHITMDKNPAYYDSKKVSIPQAVFLAIGKEYDRYRADEVDVTYGIPSDQIKIAEKEFPGQVRRATLLCSWFLEPNLESAEFKNPKVRRALNLLTDRAIITKVAGRGDKEAFQLTPPNMQGGGESAPAWKPLKREARIAEAKKLLREAGYSEEKPLEFQIVYTTSEAAKKQITALQSIWKATVPFVRPTLMNEEWKTFLDKRLQGNFSMAFAGWCSDYNDPAGMLNIFKSNNPNNAFHYKNPEFDKLMNSTLEAGISAEERARRYVSAEAMLQRDDAFIPLYHQVSINLVKPDIQGYSDRDPLKNYTIKNWSFAPKK